jgi:hypothetical protein
MVVVLRDSEHSRLGSGRQRIMKRSNGVSEDENLNVGVEVLYRVMPWRGDTLLRVLGSVNP